MLADFAGIHSAVPSIVARYKVSTFMYSLVSYVWVQCLTGAVHHAGPQHVGLYKHDMQQTCM